MVWRVSQTFSSDFFCKYERVAFGGRLATVCLYGLRNGEDVGVEMAGLGVRCAALGSAREGPSSATSLSVLIVSTATTCRGRGSLDSGMSPFVALAARTDTILLIVSMDIASMWEELSDDVQEEGGQGESGSSSWKSCKKSPMQIVSAGFTQADGSRAERGCSNMLISANGPTMGGVTAIGGLKRP